MKKLLVMGLFIGVLSVAGICTKTIADHQSVSSTCTSNQQTALIQPDGESPTVPM